VLIGDRLATSRNFVAARMIATGPLRFIFEVFYEPWTADGRAIIETKRIMLDAGSNLSRYECRFSGSDNFDDLLLTAGLARTPASDVRIEAAGGWMRVWEPLVAAGSGSVGLGLVLPPGVSPGFSWRELPGHLLALVAARETKTLIYYAGAGWDRSGDFPDRGAWDAYLSAFARELREPIRIALTRTP
jgi:hypothetical protein